MNDERRDCARNFVPRLADVCVPSSGITCPAHWIATSIYLLIPNDKKFGSQGTRENSNYLWERRREVIDIFRIKEYSSVRWASKPFENGFFNDTTLVGHK